MNIAKKTIIDFKPRSPKDGDLFGQLDPVEVARDLERKGILGISVVTEGPNFGGSLELLCRLAKAVSLPILRKDFVKSESDLYATLDCGVSYVLLIAATMRDSLPALYERAMSLGLSPVVEVHSYAEMDIAKRLDAKLIAINNKDITMLEKDDGASDTTLGLIGHAPKDAFVISASGIRNNSDAQGLIQAGAGAVLIGTAFWKGEFEL